MTPEMIAILAVGAGLAGVSVALGGLVWQSHRALRADLSAGLRDAKEDREKLRADLGGRITRVEEQMRQQGERVSRIEGMLHLHFGRNEDPDPPPAPAE